MFHSSPLNSTENISAYMDEHNYVTDIPFEMSRKFVLLQTKQRVEA